MSSRVLFFLSLTLIFTPHASATTTLETCKLSGQIQLSEDTQISCAGDLQIDDSTSIHQHGFALDIATSGNIILGHRGGKGLVVQGSGPLTIYAQTAYGYLQIEKLGAAAKSSDTLVSLEYTTLAPGYDQDLQLEDHMRVDLILNGYTMNSAGSTYKFGTVIR